MLLEADILLPITQKPIRQGGILIHNGKIADIGSKNLLQKKYPHHKIRSFRDTLLLPGFVNAHCHLEFGPCLSNKEPPPSFTTWVRQLIAKGTPKRHLLKKRIHEGQEALLKSGVTTVVDHITPDLLSLHSRQSPLRHFFCLEILGAERSRGQESLKKARKIMKASSLSEILLTPHSLYSVHHQVLLSLLQDLKKQPFFSIHLLESFDENRFFVHRSGPLARFVRERGGSVGPLSPVFWLQKQGFLRHHPLIVHGNYLSPQDLKIIKKFGLSLIHCPGSHRFFGHRPFPLDAILKSDINVALGTDSLASLANNHRLSFFSELKLMRGNFPKISPEDIIRMATLNGARAIRRAGEIGSLEIGKRADIIAMTMKDKKKDPYENVILNNKIKWTMIEGRFVDV